MGLDEILKAHYCASDVPASSDIGAAVVKLPLFVFTVLFTVLAALMIGVLHIGDRGYIRRLSAPKTESDHVSQVEAVPSTETESTTLSDEPEVQFIKIEQAPRRGFLGQWLASTPVQPITKATPQAPQARRRSYRKAYSEN